MTKAKFEFAPIPAGLNPASIVIRDIGYSDGYATVTNDAEAVVAALLRIAVQLGEPIGPNLPPIYYYDSDGALDQLEHDGTAFTGFKPGPAELRRTAQLYEGLI